MIAAGPQLAAMAGVGLFQVVVVLFHVEKNANIGAQAAPEWSIFGRQRGQGASKWEEA